ncbi:hypothetical protein DRQ32_09650 [bacterium]|nr:MAG: hypothetical protein DRQ32_09650 [bacterium]
MKGARPCFRMPGNSSRPGGAIVKWRMYLAAALLAATILPEAGFAQTSVLRAALVSGGGLSSGASVTLRASFGESTVSVPGVGNIVIRTGVWLPHAPVPTAIDGTPPAIIFPASLGQNYPNPFNPRTVIPFSITHAGQHVQLEIYNIAGRHVRTLVDGPLPAGPQEIVWDGTDAHQHAVASGVYVYLLQTSDFRARRKLVLVR